MAAIDTIDSSLTLVPSVQQAQANARQQNLIDQAVAEIMATADLHPGVTIIHNMLTDSVEYMSRRGLALLQTTMPALRALGAGYHAFYFNPADAADYLPKVYEMVQSMDSSEVASFFQQVRTTENPEYSWYFSSLRVLLRADDGTALLIITTACPVDPLHHVTHKVNRLLQENNFLRQHAVRFGQLTVREREVLRRLALGESAPDTAVALFLSVQTVETHRRNLRRKLGTQTSYELVEYSQAFDLI